jgi:hypothetical protein
MGRKSKIKIGDWYGMWKVVDIDNIEQNGPNRKALCECGECGHQKLVFTNNLLSGRSHECHYCSTRSRRPTYGHPRILRVDSVIGTLTILRSVPFEEWRDLGHNTKREHYRHHVEARCLCGNTIIAQADVIKRDEFPTCHHCAENATLYVWDDRISATVMTEHADGRESRWFDMTTKPPTEHQTIGYQFHLTRIKEMKNNE